MDVIRWDVTVSQQGIGTGGSREVMNLLTHLSKKTVLFTGASGKKVRDPAVRIILGKKAHKKGTTSHVYLGPGSTF